jgi:hypothetical protein
MPVQPNSAGEVEDAGQLVATPDVGGDLPDPDQTPVSEASPSESPVPGPTVPEPPHPPWASEHRRRSHADQRGAVLAAAAAEIGTKERPAGSNRVKYTAWYGLVGPWCDMFQAWVADRTGTTDILGRFAYTPSHAAWFKRRGQWHTSAPRPGDLVFFDFGLGRISHVGLVERVVSSSRIQTIEGNTDVSGGRTGGQVMRKTRRTSLVVGYGRPDYGSASVTAADATASGIQVVDPPPDPKVKTWQALLAFAPARRDGIWGPDTEQRSQWMATAARTKSGTLRGSARSTIRLIQRVIGTPDDGEWGPKSRAAMTRWITRAQKFLGVEPDGEWGPLTQAAYERFRPRS